VKGDNAFLGYYAGRETKMSDDELGSISRRQFLQISAVSLTSAQGALTETVLDAATAQVPAATTTAAKYILTRLSQHGVNMLFGVPGATCDPLFAAARSTGMAVVVNSSDLEAGYAADGFARMRGLGAVAVTYGVGTMSLLPAIGGAYAERSPVVLINGGPSAEDLRLQKELGTLFSHSIGREKTDLTIFREVTEYAARAEKASDVPKVVDTALRTALTAQRPVYIEIPKHLWDAKCPAPEGALDVSLTPSGQESLIAAELIEKLRAASRPVLLLGIEVQRYGLENAVTALVEKLQLPWATTMLAKSVIPEQTAGFVGVYGGERAVPSVKKIIEGADAVLAIGCVMGRQYRRLVTQSRDKLMLLANQAAQQGRGPAIKAALAPVLAELQRQPWQPNPEHIERTRHPGLSFRQRRASVPAPKGAAGAMAERGLTYDEVLEEVSGFLDESFIAITDTSLSMYPAAELNVTGRKGFLCNAVWQAIGYSVGAAVGVGLAQDRRPLVICGDGGFQMTAQSLSTMAQRKMRAVVIVLDNGHYGIEQWLLDPRFFRDPATPLLPYLALNRWNYAELAKSLGFSSAKMVEALPDLRQLLADSKNSPGPVLIHALIKPRDVPSVLREA
jgi:indolepyruvate decarboxylase